MMTIVGLLVLGYVAGSLPFGVWVAKAHGIDIMSVGSGNIGATNVRRALGIWWGVAVFVLDMGKGAAPALVGRLLVHDRLIGFDAEFVWLMAGFSAVVGHMKSPFLGFRGGKGVSTAMGAALAGAPLVALSSFTLFLLILLTAQYMAVASIIGVTSSILFATIIPHQSPQCVGLFALMSLSVVLMHRQNIIRLRNGDEPKFKFKK